MALTTNVRNAWQALRGAPIQTRRTTGVTTMPLTSGGIVNTGSGMGTSLDKGNASFFKPTRYFWRSPLEILCVESWVARNAIEIPNNDMFIRWREHTADDAKAAEAMMDGAEDLELEIALNRAMKAGEQYGSGIVVMVTAEADLAEPLIPRRIREGDLQALYYFDRYDMSVTQRDWTWGSKNFGKPEYYMLHPQGVSLPMMVHHSRILRFDGIRPPTLSGYTVYDQDFGVSVLVPIIVSLLEDQTLASAITHMSQEASIPVLNIAGLREAIAGMGDEDEATPAQIGQEINLMKSVYRLLMLDEPGRETFSRVQVAFGGLPELLEKFQNRVAAARQIPVTRFMGRSPAGMNATGESDMRNYVMMMEASRARMLKAPLKRLDEVLARHVGLREAPDYEWLSLLELSDQEIAQAAKTKAEALKIGLDAMALDEDEMRDALNGDPVFGELPGPAPEPDPEDLLADMPNMPTPQPTAGNGNGNGSNGNGARSPAR